MFWAKFKGFNKTNSYEFVFVGPVFGDKEATVKQFYQRNSWTNASTNLLLKGSVLTVSLKFVIWRKSQLHALNWMTE